MMPGRWPCSNPCPHGMLTITHRWLDKGEDDGQIERELFPSSSIVGGTNWKLTVITGAWLGGWVVVGPHPHAGSGVPGRDYVQPRCSRIRWDICQGLPHHHT